jgi:hypothetical protein
LRAINKERRETPPPPVEKKVNCCIVCGEEDKPMVTNGLRFFQCRDCALKVLAVLG